MWSLQMPGSDECDALCERSRGSAFSYAEIGVTRTMERGREPTGFNYDETRAKIGDGAGAFDAACAALRSWVMFPAPWTKILPMDAPIREGTIVAMRADALGLWWLNACRIVYVIDETGVDSDAGASLASGTGTMRRFGFAYGTLPQHVETGEERFSVELHADNSVWYDLRAFSRPRYWPVRLAKPLARRLQGRFAQESVAAMKRAVSAAAGGAA